MLRVSNVALAIREHLIAKSASVDDALSRACHDVHLRECRIMALEAELARAQREASAGYLRRAPSHPARALDPPPPSVSDEWIATGRE
jgi:hypothetical protein